MFFTRAGKYENKEATKATEDMMTPKNIPDFWQDLAGALALAVLVVATLHLPLFS